MPMKYHYIIYRVEKNGQRTRIDSAQDRFMLWAKEEKWRKAVCATITHKREAISKEEWKRLYW